MSAQDNQRRAETIEDTLSFFAHQTGLVDGEGEPLASAEEVAIDLLTNLMHFCAESGDVEFEEALRLARMHFAAERREAMH